MSLIGSIDSIEGKTILFSLHLLSSRTQEQQEVWDIDAIVDRRENRAGDREYFVKFTGYGEEDNLWYTEQDLRDMGRKPFACWTILMRHGIRRSTSVCWRRNRAKESGVQRGEVVGSRVAEVVCGSLGCESPKWVRE